VLKDRGVRKNAFLFLGQWRSIADCFGKRTPFLFFGALAMIDSKDEKWLKRALKECFDSGNGKANKGRRLLEGFSMLVRNMVKNLEDDLAEAEALWQKEPTSRELKKKFDSLARCLFYLERYCREKIGRELS